PKSLAPEDESKAIQKQKGLTVLNVSEREGEQAIVPVESDKFLGKTIEGKYQILTLLGRGGMSCVYKGKLGSTQKIVAVKIMHSHLLGDELASRRFQQEAMAASRLNHPNAVSVFDLGVTDSGQPFLTMEYLRGVALSDEIAELGRLSVLRTLHIFIQAAAAVSHAHQKSIIHRDLKP